MTIWIVAFGKYLSIFFICQKRTRIVINLANPTCFEKCLTCAVYDMHWKIPSLWDKRWVFLSLSEITTPKCKEILTAQLTQDRKLIMESFSLAHLPAWLLLSFVKWNRLTGGSILVQFQWPVNRLLTDVFLFLFSLKSRAIFWMKPRKFHSNLIKQKSLFEMLSIFK